MGRLEKKALRTGRARRVRLSDAVLLAKELLGLVSREELEKAERMRDEVMACLNEMIETLTELPMPSRMARVTLGYRVARAEAETLQGACLMFERTCAQQRPNRDDDEPAVVACEVLRIAIGRFIAMADRL